MKHCASRLTKLRERQQRVCVCVCECNDNQFEAYLLEISSSFTACWLLLAGNVMEVDSLQFQISFC